MKTLLIIGLGSLLLSCHTTPAVPNASITAMLDLTDKPTSYPTADELLAPLDLKGDPYQQVRVCLTTVSDRDINNSTVLSLEGAGEWSSNRQLRRAQVERFGKKLQKELTSLLSTAPSAHSVIYRAVVAQANELARSQAKRKVLILFSNLYENSDLDFYDPNVMRQLQARPADLEKRLAKETAIRQLHGLEVWLVYQPVDYRDNNNFMPIAHLYQIVLQAHGATVTIATKFQAL